MCWLVEFYTTASLSDICVTTFHYYLLQIVIESGM